MIWIPEKTRFIFEILEKNEYECFAVGGCVRDSLMNIIPDDWDFTTNATPDEIIECFKDYKLITVGQKYGTIGVVCNNSVYEITTFRKDGVYSDSRHPDTIEFSPNIEDDLVRRDFTINSMAYNPKTGIIDPYGGQLDLSNKLIRCTGDPYKRFDEDALRIMRALRFSSRFGFDIEKTTSKAIFDKKSGLTAVHPQRLKKEISGLIMGSGFHKVLESYAEVLATIIPDIEITFAFPQNTPHHCFDVWNHTLKALKNTPADEEIRLCVLFHDLGKPLSRTIDKKGRDHFKGHPVISAEIAERHLKKFGFPAKTVSNVVNLVRFHDERFKKGDYDIKKLLGILGEELFFKLMVVAISDVLAQSDYRREEKINLLKSVERRAREIIDSDECYSLSNLMVKGDDLVSLGYNGREIGCILNELLDAVISDRCDNSKEALIGYIPLVIDKIRDLS